MSPSQIFSQFLMQADASLAIDPFRLTLSVLIIGFFLSGTLLASVARKKAIPGIFGTLPWGYLAADTQGFVYNFLNNGYFALLSVFFMLYGLIMTVYGFHLLNQGEVVLTRRARRQREERLERERVERLRRAESPRAVPTPVTDSIRADSVRSKVIDRILRLRDGDDNRERPGWEDLK